MNISDNDIKNNLFDSRFTKMQESHILTGSIHKRALELLTAEQLSQWQEFLRQRNLI